MIPGTTLIAVAIITAASMLAPRPESGQVLEIFSRALLECVGVGLVVLAVVNALLD